MHAAAVPVLSEGSGGPFDLINGIPVHPLVVHAAVVLVPLTALGLIVMAVWPRFSARYGWLVAVSGVLAAGSSFAAKESGEVLEGRVGEPGFDHAELGDQMPIFAAVLLVAVVALWLIDRSAPTDGPAPRRGLRIAVAIVGVVVALANLLWVFRVGDSGAKSVWSGRVSASARETTTGTGNRRRQPVPRPNRRLPRRPTPSARWRRTVPPRTAGWPSVPASTT